MILKNTSLFIFINGDVFLRPYYERIVIVMSHLLMYYFKKLISDCFDGVCLSKK